VATVHCLDAKTGALLWKAPLQFKVCDNDQGITCTTSAECGAGNCISRDHVWGSPTVANGRVFVGIASHTDQPCTQGRLVALDLDTGALLWTHATVPDRVCSNDTGIVCTSDAECAPGTCVSARGAGVTATVAVDASGEAVFMNTVGCYTFPSVGDSDSIFRLDAATGDTVWKRRVQPPEQFGICSNDGSIECGSDAPCGAGTCTTKTFYHDFGFLNGPLLVEADDGFGGTRPLVASGSKDGTLYAFDPTDGGAVWTRAVVPTPVSPAFAGFGLFNAAVGFADQRFFAALYEQVPPAMPAPDHLMAFSAVDGSTAWSDDIGISWGSIALAGGLVFAGTQDTTDFFVYDATTGTRLKTFGMPSNVASGASVVGGTVYVGYGEVTPDGGVQAFALP
jgi:outer membrane protein assembly factor BamB